MFRSLPDRLGGKTRRDFRERRQKTREGLSAEAEKILTHAIESYDPRPRRPRQSQTPSVLYARNARQLQGIARGPDQPFEDEDFCTCLEAETQVACLDPTRDRYNNLGDQPEGRHVAEGNTRKGRGARTDASLRQHRYRASPAFTASSTNTRSAATTPKKHSIIFARTATGSAWPRPIARSPTAIIRKATAKNRSRYFDLGIKIIGEQFGARSCSANSTPICPGAYWFLRRPQDGIACLEKSIEFFDQTEHALNTVIAYNNLGIHLMLIGEWTKAEKMIKRALDIGRRDQITFMLPGFYDSLGELKILRGELDEAEELLEQGRGLCQKSANTNGTRSRRCAISPAVTWHRAKSTKPSRKRAKPSSFQRTIGDKHYANMAGLVLAESYLSKGRSRSARIALQIIEENDPSSDFFVLGNIQRIRGLAALEDGDGELAVHHFNRRLTIFEAAEDIYHTALLHYLLGENLDRTKSAAAINI